MYTPFHTRLRCPRSIAGAALATLVIAATFSGPATAQGLAIAPIDHTDPAATQFPFHLAGVTRSTQFPFSAGVSRVMYVFDTRLGTGASVLNLPNGAAINQLSFPADGTRQAIGHSLQMQITMAHTTRTSADADGTFANNYTGAPTVVFPTGIFTLPYLNNPNSPTPIQSVEVPFTTPFVFNGTDNILVDIQIFANSNANSAFVYSTDSGRGIGPVESLGGGCPTSGGNIPTLTSTATLLDNNWRINLSQANASANVALHIGFGLYPTPIPIPGAPGCTFGVQSATSVSTVASTSGSASWSFAVGNNPVLWQLDVYSQALSCDLFANQLGVITSNIDHMTVGIEPQMTMITSTGNASATSGSPNRNNGQIVYFHY